MCLDVMSSIKVLFRRQRHLRILLGKYRIRKQNGKWNELTKILPNFDLVFKKKNLCSYLSLDLLLFLSDKLKTSVS